MKDNADQRKKPAEPTRDRKLKRVKRRCVSKPSHKLQNDLLEKNAENERKGELLRSKIKKLQEVTPNCPKSGDVRVILDSAMEYVCSLQLQCLLINAFWGIPYQKRG